MGTKASTTTFTLYNHLFGLFFNFTVILLSSVPYMCAAGSFAAMFAGLHPASSPSAGSTLTPVHCVRVIHRPVPVATNGVVPVFAIVAIVPIAVIAVCYPVIYEGSVLILTELADQLGFQGY